MTVPAMLRSTRYSGIENRREQLPQVEQELQCVIDAQPTQIHPDDREGYICAILADLECVEGAVWCSWPEEVHLLALTALRILGRNPMGSQSLFSSASIAILLFHAALRPASDPSKPADQPCEVSLDISPRSATATETLKILANLLVLHPIARKRVTRAGGCRAVVRALAGVDTACPSAALAATEAGEAVQAEHDGREMYLEGEDTPERVFLLARLLFLMTAGEEGLVRELVEKEDVVDALVYHLLHLPPVPAHYDALTELFKAANNLVGAYSADKVAWTDKLDPLIHASIIHLHLNPLLSLGPPLTQIVHVLFTTPLNANTSPTLSSAPEVAPGSPTSAMRAISLGAPAHVIGSGAGAASQVQNGVRNLMHKIGQLPGQIRGMAGGGGHTPDLGAGGAGAEASAEAGVWAGLGLSGVNAAPAASTSPSAPGDSSASMDRSKTLRERLSFSSGRPSLASLSPTQLAAPLPSTSPQSQPPSRRPSATAALPSASSPGLGSSRTAVPRLTLPLPPLRPDPIALPRRIFLLLQDWMNRYLPSTSSPDSELHSRTAIDEVLPPVLLLLCKVCQAEENTEGRGWVKRQLLPDNLDRSAEKGELEKREGTLGCLLRLMGCTRFASSKAAAGELIWVICDSDAATMSAEIGYGNAAGFLFHKGITQPPPGKITEITDRVDGEQNATSPAAPSQTSAAAPTAAAVSAEPRHPITSLTDGPSANINVRAASLSEMKPEEKEREAERLFVLFQRMEKNPVLSLGAETAPPSSSSPSIAPVAADGARMSSKDDAKNANKDAAAAPLNIQQLMRRDLESGQHAQLDAKEEAEEAERREREDEADEAEVGREMAAYRARMGR